MFFRDNQCNTYRELSCNSQYSVTKKNEMNKVKVNSHMPGLIGFLLLLGSFVAQAQTCNIAIPLNSPDSRYQNNGDGTVIDLYTGLMWQRCTAGRSGVDCTSGNATRFTWEEALQYPSDINASGGYAGMNDWRLPNAKELDSLVEYSCINPAINATFFPETSDFLYWSSSPYYSLRAWSINFAAGGATWYGARTGNNRVRLVRAGQ